MYVCMSVCIIYEYDSGKRKRLGLIILRIESMTIDKEKVVTKQVVLEHQCRQKRKNTNSICDPGNRCIDPGRQH